MELLVELDNMNRAREAELIMEKNNALVFLKVERTAKIIRAAGLPVSLANIAEFGFLTLREVEDAINWMSRGKKAKPLPFTVDEQVAPQSDLAKVFAGLLWLESRTKSKRGDKPLPPQDAAVVGVQRIMQLTGLGRPVILDLVQQNKEAIQAEFPDFRDAWVNDTKEIIQKNAKNQHPETKIRLIRQAVEEIAAGRLGKVSGEQLARWKNGAIGLDKRQIDKLLQTVPELRDLDKYRAIGTHYMKTDADRAAEYQRMRNA